MSKTPQQRSAVRVLPKSLFGELEIGHRGKLHLFPVTIVNLSDSGAAFELDAVCVLRGTFGISRFTLPTGDRFSLRTEVVRFVPIEAKDAPVVSERSCRIGVRFMHEHERTRDKIVKYTLAQDLLMRRYRDGVER